MGTIMVHIIDSYHEPPHTFGCFFLFKGVSWVRIMDFKAGFVSRVDTWIRIIGKSAEKMVAGMHLPEKSGHDAQQKDPDSLVS